MSHNPGVKRFENLLRGDNVFPVLTLGRTCKFIPLGFCYDVVLRNDFAFSGKPLRYILLVVALPEAYDVTNNGRHFGRHLGFYQELEIRLKLREMVTFCAWNKK